MVDGPRPLRWQVGRKGLRMVEDYFTGEDLVGWLVNEFVDIPDRATALLQGNSLVQQGDIIPTAPPKRLIDR